MPFVPVSSEGAVLYYEDSGPPPGNRVYNTLVLTHGTGLHCGVFHKIFALAPQHGIRLVIFNRRDFNESTPLTLSDIEKIMKQPEDGNEEVIAEMRRSYFRDRASEFATFLEYVVDKLDIPKISVNEDGNRGTGGFALMAWSAGNMYGVSLLAYADVIAERRRKKLEPYFRKLFLYDPPRWPLGPTAMNSVDKILIDESLSPEERGRIFGEWVSGYYSHRSVTSHNYDDLELLKPVTNPPPTTTVMSMEEIVGMTSSLGAESDMRLQRIDPAILEEQTRRAIFDENIAKRAWPNVVVEHIWCDRSPWVVIDALWYLETLKSQAGGKGRKFTSSQMAGANHYPHWDMPEETIRMFTDKI